MDCTRNTCLSATQNLILGFHHHKIVLNSKCHFFWLQKWIELGHVGHVANFWLSRHGMSPNMAAPYETLCNFGNIVDYSHFAKIMTRKWKIGNLTNMTEFYPFLELKKVVFAI